MASSLAQDSPLQKRRVLQFQKQLSSPTSSSTPAIVTTPPGSSGVWCIFFFNLFLVEIGRTFTFRRALQFIIIPAYITHWQLCSYAIVSLFLLIYAGKRENTSLEL